LLIWLAFVFGLLAFPMVTRAGASTSRSRSWTAVVAAIVMAFAAVSSVVGAVTGARGRTEYTMNAGDARDRVIHFELTGHPVIQWSSTKGPVDLKTYFPNPDGTTATFTVRPESPVAGTAIEVVVDVSRPGNRPGWGTARVDCGDGSPPIFLAIEGGARTRHTYGQPGDYQVRVDFQLWGLDPRTNVQRVHVSPP
jgi:hypothetical protein